MLNSEDLINKIKGYNKFVNLDRLDKAYNFAVKAHNNQKRASGRSLLSSSNRSSKYSYRFKIRLCNNSYRIIT